MKANTLTNTMYSKVKNTSKDDSLNSLQKSILWFIFWKFIFVQRHAAFLELISFFFFKELVGWLLNFLALMGQKIKFELTLKKLASCLKRISSCGELTFPLALRGLPSWGKRINIFAAGRHVLLRQEDFFLTNISNLTFI